MSGDLASLKAELRQAQRRHYMIVAAMVASIIGAYAEFVFIALALALFGLAFVNLNLMSRIERKIEINYGWWELER